MRLPTSTPEGPRCTTSIIISSSMPAVTTTTTNSNNISKGPRSGPPSNPPTLRDPRNPYVRPQGALPPPPLLPLPLQQPRSWLRGTASSGPCGNAGWPLPAWLSAVAALRRIPRTTRNSSTSSSGSSQGCTRGKREAGKVHGTEVGAGTRATKSRISASRQSRD